MTRKPSLLYLLLWVLAFCSIPYSLFLLVDLITHPLVPEFFSNSVGLRWLIGFFAAPITLAIGFLVTRRMPGNVIGPMLMVWGGCIATWAIRNDIDITTMAVLSNLASVGWGILCLLGFYFPSGEVVPAKWHPWISWFALGSILATFAAITTAPTLSFLLKLHPNPLYIPVLQPLNNINNYLAASSILFLPLAVYSIYRRYKVAELKERQQIKWLGFAFLSLLLLTPITIVVQGVEGVIAESVYLLSFAWIYMFPAVCVGNAILRHRLYDIDIIIRRTLIYSILSAILLGVYFGIVILVQQVFQSATGEVPDFAVVLSTLLIAALFNPLRQRIQAQIDRQFYRRKYDVEQTLAEFQQNLREEVDMPTLQSNLVAVVNETMQPSSIRLWVKESK